MSIILKDLSGPRSVFITGVLKEDRKRNGQPHGQGAKREELSYFVLTGEPVIELTLKKIQLNRVKPFGGCALFGFNFMVINI